MADQPPQQRHQQSYLDQRQYQGYQEQQHQQGQNPIDVIKSFLPQNGPSASNVLAVVILVPIGGTLLLLAGLTLAATILGLAITTPLFVLFSPILVPAALVIALSVAGILCSGAFGITGLSSFSWLAHYLSRTRQPEQLAEKVSETTSHLGQKLQDTAGYVGQKGQETAGYVGQKGQDTAGYFGQKGQETAGYLAKKGQETAGKAGQKTREAGENVQSKAQEGGRAQESGRTRETKT